MWHDPGRYKLAMAVVLCILLGACVALRNHAPGNSDRGIKFPHPLHAEQGIGCADCHDLSSPDTVMPGHDMCSVCHDINMDEATEEMCGFCHTREDFSMDELKSVLTDEVIWSHDPHIAAEVECAACHTEPDARVIPAGDTMQWCMDCHGATDPKLNDCAVCHKELRIDVVPKYRGETRIAHDAPQVWEQIHGREARIDAEYCAVCHDKQDDCTTCHSVNKPKSHTMSFVRKTHGLEAAWDRAKCSACHEEDSCLKCHQNNKPTSHRGGFGSPLNTHCVQCHFEENNSCSVCHESIEHPSALPSPHTLGIYPANCALCHPGGLPLQAPHVMNSTVGCIVCHN